VSPASRKPKYLILDACVLIDFVKADRSVLASVTKQVGTIYVINPVVSEVLDIEDANELSELGIIIIEPEIEDAFKASVGTGATSFQDRLCMLTAKRNGFTCVTNDTNLRKLCESENVPLLWGLQLILELHKLKGISIADALRIVNQIHIANPKHITNKIILRFTENISKQEQL
jgi:hypothetical protein